MTDPSKKITSDVLTGDEQITLRGVAFGESPAHTLRAADLNQLRARQLIEDGKDGPVLTTRGRRLYETLPRALGSTTNADQDTLLDSLSKVLREGKR